MALMLVFPKILIGICELVAMHHLQLYHAAGAPKSVKPIAICVYVILVTTWLLKGLSIGFWIAGS